MAKCVECGTAFEIEDARKEYNDEFNGDPDFDDEGFGEGELCGGCAASVTSSAMNHGNAILMMNGELDYDDEHVQKYL
ncbi:hypothetical protein E6R61_21015 [Streptomyces sp. LRa12]|uniref:hypothetical protein n=1 Tax=Streptomyces sp. LRa12 TaxID=2563107 RepID=UPI00109EBC60|nr:hypothetical protein [Streptomyces sp. LRa12]THA90184.1 hypothetical protein E6R61_21015 [Streptomyces sp. LRa12]